MAFWRMFLASVLLGGYSVLTPRENINRKNKLYLLTAGILLGFHFSTFFAGVQFTTIANATLFGTLAPVFTAIIDKVKGKTINRGIITGLVLSISGTVIIQTVDITRSDYFIGNSLSLLSSFFMALVWIQGKKVRKSLGTITYSRNLFLIAAITILFIVIFSGDSIFDFQKKHLAWFLFLGIVPSILGHNLLNYSIRYISPTAVSSVVLGEPIIASILGYFFFQEAIPKTSLLGGPLILFGIYLILNNQSK
tara:strand:+ start:2036 stop:2788 length:753 start_codon:yes stop_codon:yes gene_type:complete